jgi:hypothetical protein
MKETEELLQRFYSAFNAGDYKTMQAAYHHEAMFSDPVFRNLDCHQVQSMWEMLVTSARDLKISASDFQTSNTKGSCSWQAWYTFSKTGRPVHNWIKASFEFKDGLIIRHTDEFDFYRWSKQALGLQGTLLGWTPLVRNAVRDTAMRSLEKFMSRNTSPQKA